jgi:putative transposase
MKVGPSEAEPFWTEFLRSLNRRGPTRREARDLRQPRGLKAAAAKVLKADLAALPGALPAQRARARRQDPAADGARRHQHRVRPGDTEAAVAQWRIVADQLRGKFPKLGA